MSIVPLSDERSPGLLAPMGADERQASIHLRLPGGRVVSGGAAAVGVARELPGTRRVAAAAQRSDAATRAVERAYRAIARHRHGLARLVPDRDPVTRWYG